MLGEQGWPGFVIWALQQGHIVYLFGALVIGIAYQPLVYMQIALQIALVEQVRRRRIPPVPRFPRPKRRVVLALGSGEAA